MSIYRKITKKYLLGNRRRTIFTLLGITLSIALITSIGIFLISSQDYMHKQTKSEYGSYHLKIKHANNQASIRLQANPQIKKVGTLSRERYFLSDGRKIEIKSVDQEAFSLLPFATIREQGNNGLIIEKWAAADIQSMEQPIILRDALGGHHTYNLKRIVENNKNLHEGQDLQAFIIQNKIQNLINLDLYVELSELANYQEVYNYVLSFIPKENIEVNYPLVGAEYDDNNRAIFYSAVYILPIVIVVIATIAFIFNTFQISIVERVRDISLLRTIGATKRQIKKMITYEMAFFGIISIPLGLILGIMGFWVIISLYQLIYVETEFSLLYFPIVISPGVVIVSSFIGVFSLILSGIIPNKIANRTSPLEAGRRINKSSGVKTNKRYLFFKKWVTIESTMAIRNIYRNKLKSFIVIFSLSLSFFLFTVFSNFVILVFDIEAGDKMSDDFRIQFTESVSLPDRIWTELGNISEIKKKNIHYFKEGSQPASSTINYISIDLKDKAAVNKVEKELEQITMEYPYLEIVNEQENLRNQSSVLFQVKILLYGFVIVIAFIGVLNIMNTITMNIILRKQEYATLMAIGMSLKGLQKMVIKEGMFYALISGVIGFSFAVFIEFLLFFSTGFLDWADSIKLYLSAFLVLLVSCYISAKLSSNMLKNGQLKDSLRSE
ncbi:ABC transporter permease [Cytobacillus massiliigabonensis]|uniref:ABC transporter permease n=1 Tax=Cytobacillus massiliigabonensis TaxID=1871011 RepID=UPI000C8446AF|nr:FtsX-like permease family protein [Cytobacillus massiliigabonensis]